MRKTCVIEMLLVAVWLAPAVAQDTMPVVQNDNFRVQVSTNRDVYHYRDVLRLTVEVLNDSGQVLHISRADDVLANAEADLDAGEVVCGRLDDDLVDVVIEPEVCPIIIGWARLVPLYRPIDTGLTDEAVVPEKRIRLGLFGPTTIQPHSTRILSTANILIGWPLSVEPLPDPAEADAVTDEAKNFLLNLLIRKLNKSCKSWIKQPD